MKNFLHTYRINSSYIFLFTIGLLNSSCSNTTKSMEEMQPYTGPIMEVDTMKTIYSEEGKTKVIVNANKQLVLQNGDREFPIGVIVDFYEDGQISSTLTSNFGHFYKDENKYMVSGDVIIDNKKEGKKLNTEELFWYPSREKIHVDESKQVIITTKTDLLKGMGLDANQDFSSYKILRPSGETTLK